MKYLIACLLLSSYLPGFSQRISPVAYANSIDSADLRQNLYQIAGPAMQGRETATDGQKAAAAYIEQRFRELGLQPGWHGEYQQRFPVYRDSLVKAALVVNDRQLMLSRDFTVSNNSVTNDSLSAQEVIYLGDKPADSIAAIAGGGVQGKIMIVSAPKPSSRQNKGRSRRPDYRALQQAALKSGAAGLLIIDKDFPREPSDEPLPMYVKDERSAIVPNTFFISDSVARLIMGKDYASAKKIKKTQEPGKIYRANVSMVLEKSTDTLESSNVLGVLEGTDKKNEVVVITAHYDHLGIHDSQVYYGADDDGSGTVTVMELAEAFANAAKDGHGPRRTILFMTVSGEEKGLWGSNYYAEHPAFPLDSTSVDINIDMIGRVEANRRSADTANYVYVVGDNKLSSDLRPISEKMNTDRAGLSLDYKYNAPEDPERIYYRSDHYNFARKGVPAIFYFSGLHQDYHRPTDTPDKIRYDLLEKRARLIFYTAWEMANRDEMLKRDLKLQE